MTGAWTLALVSTGSTLTPGLAAMVEWCALMLPTKVSDGKCIRLISAISSIIRPISNLPGRCFDNPSVSRPTQFPPKLAFILLTVGCCGEVPLFLSDFSDGGYYFMGEPRDAPATLA